MSEKKISNILYLSSFPPRECGIATFTNDLSMAFDKIFNPITKSKIAAINESQTSFYNYSSKVWKTITAGNLEHYVHLAEKINSDNNIKIVNIQHEFGLFGGEWGDYLIPFLQVVKKPIIITLHSVIPSPDDRLKNIVSLINDRSKMLVVMNERSRQTLKNDYAVSKSKICLIPHGIPNVAFESPKNAKKELGLENKTVLSTFGMLNPDKGIEYAIRALPKIVKEFPNIIYLIIGATHPLVRQDEGESYRNFLINEVERLKLKQHVKFYNKYLTLEEIIQYLKATDLYIYSPATPVQSVSGTLSYALGCGRPVIATPTEYAKHIIIPERNGFFIRFKDPISIKKTLLKILKDEKYIKTLQRGAYESTRHMIWPNIATAYFKLYKKYADIQDENKKLPKIKLDHLMRMTDNFGILHHARYSRPEKRFGYNLDDNARALIAAAHYYENNPQPEILNLIKTYLNFMKFVQRPNGSFANIVTAKKQKDKTSGEDVQGRGIWALGYAASRQSLPSNLIAEAEKLLKKSLKSLRRIYSPRATAFAMTGIYFYLKSRPSRRIQAAFQRLAKQQLNFYLKNASPDWQWFENHLTYSNSKMPESLFYAYDLTKNEKYLKAAETTLKFLKNITFEARHYSPIGQNGWYFRHKKRAYFDQQPEDTASMVQTKLAAYKITANKQHLEDAYKAFQWFLGKNYLNQMVCDETTGGCHDGLDKYGLNLNQGAESTISYLLARLSFEDPEITKDEIKF